MQLYFRSFMYHHGADRDNVALLLCICVVLRFRNRDTKVRGVESVVKLNSSVFWVIEQRRLVKYRRFGTTYQSHHQKSDAQDTRFPETSVFNQPTLRNNPEDVSIQVNRSESLGLRLLLCCVHSP